MAGQLRSSADALARLCLSACWRSKLGHGVHTCSARLGPAPLVHGSRVEVAARAQAAARRKSGRAKVLSAFVHLAALEEGAAGRRLGRACAPGARGGGGPCRGLRALCAAAPGAAADCAPRRGGRPCVTSARTGAAQENGAIFEALRTMAACYLRADTEAICACIQAFGLNDLLFSIARLERLYNKRACNGARALPLTRLCHILGLHSASACACETVPAAVTCSCLTLCLLTVCDICCGVVRLAALAARARRPTSVRARRHVRGGRQRGAARGAQPAAGRLHSEARRRVRGPQRLQSARRPGARVQRAARRAADQWRPPRRANALLDEERGRGGRRVCRVRRRGRAAGCRPAARRRRAPRRDRRRHRWVGGQRRGREGERRLDKADRARRRAGGAARRALPPPLLLLGRCIVLRAFGLQSRTQVHTSSPERQLTC